MRCHAVQNRLVAWRDHELSPGEMTRVTEHLATCARCLDAEARLARATPAPVVVPASIAARLAAATRIDHLLAEAARPERAERYPPPSRWRRALTEAIELPAWTVAAAIALFALTAGWATQMTLAYQAAQARAAVVATRTIPLPAVADPAPVDLPAEQFQPAAYQPGADREYR